MSITLKIISYQRLTPGQEKSFTSDASRISIGRNPDNDWVLPDPQRFMSGTHCHLELRGGNWYITDTSTNGVFINSSDHRMAKNESQVLHHGDRIRLGDYELETEIGTGPNGRDALEETSTDIPIDEGLDPAGSAAPPSRDEKPVNTPLSQMDRGLLGSSVKIDDIFRLDEEPEKEEPESLASQGERGFSLHQHFTPPKIDDSKAEPAESPSPDKYYLDPDSIDSDWDFETGLTKIPSQSELRTDSPRKEPEPPEVKPEKAAAAEPAPAARKRAASPGTSGAVAAFAEGAGLDPGALDVADEAAFFTEIGLLVRTMTEGLRQAMASRGQIKSEFRLQQTMIGPAGNNPLKFSVSDDEALIRLLKADSDAYLAGPDATAEAIDDINAHQMGVLAGTEAALRGILRRFKPASVEEKLARLTVLDRFIPAARKAKCWELYKTLYEQDLDAAYEDFQQLFGTEFADAYQKQLDRLKIARKDSEK